MKSTGVRDILEDLIRFESATSQSDRKRVLAGALLFVRQRLGLPYVSAALWDPEKRKLTVTGGEDSETSLPPAIPTGLTAMALSNSTTVYGRDILHDWSGSKALGYPLPGEVRSLAVLPLNAQGETLGTLNVGAAGIDGIPQEQRKFLEVLAARLAGRLGNLKAIEDLTLARKRLQQECDLQKSALQKSRDELEEQVAQRTKMIRRLQERLQAENLYLIEELAVTHPYGEIIGESPSLKSVVARIDLVAPTDASVLVSGESGTGKELVAREIHRHSRRRERPLIKVNCATIPMELYESEFFGHVKGAFTGAISDRVGRFEAADGGTLFLDEVAEIPLGLQGKLLRVLQEGEFERVGEGRTRRVDVRIIAATNKNLAEEIRHGRFREDLYYRLNVFPIEITPLRDRKEDIPALAHHFLDKLARRMNRAAPRLSKANIDDLSAHRWPGNARELQNVIERALILSPQDRLNLDLPRIDDGKTADGHADAEPPQASFRTIMTEVQIRELGRRNMLNALERTNWKIYGKDGAARLLGLKPTTLIERMRAMGIRRPKEI